MFKLIIFLLSLLSISLAGDLKLSCDFETGYVPQWSSMMYQSDSVYSFHCSKHTMFVSAQLGTGYKGLYAKLRGTTFASPVKGGYTAMPFRGSWDTEIGYKLHFLTFKYAHNCGHTIVTNSKPLKDQPTLTDVSYDKFSVTISFSNQSSNK